TTPTQPRPSALAKLPRVAVVGRAPRRRRSLRRSCWPGSTSSPTPRWTPCSVTWSRTRQTDERRDTITGPAPRLGETGPARRVTAQADRPATHVAGVVRAGAAVVPERAEPRQPVLQRPVGPAADRRTGRGGAGEEPDRNRPPP